MAILPRSAAKLIPLVLLGVLAIHAILSLTSSSYAASTRPSRILGGGGYLSQPAGDYHSPGSWAGKGHELQGSLRPPPNGTWEAGGRRKANAVFVVLARNSDLFEILPSMGQMEHTFNHWGGYDWLFLNEEPFSDEFKKLTQEMTPSKCKYGLIEPSHWHQPEWIDEEKATAARNEMIEKKVIYGHSVPYRNMCRFNSGFFYKHPMLAEYDYYWRVEPSVKFYCDLAYDPFLAMMDKGAVYGFTLSLFEYVETVPTLWEETKKFLASRPDLAPLMEGNAMKFLSDDNGETYNLCHFWSNFEIGALSLWRSEPYQAYFDFLDKAGGFYYERWGDAPVHSIGAALFAKKEQIMWFSDIGYRHEPFMHCPQEEEHTRGRCSCNPHDSFSFNWYSCTQKFLNM